MAGKQVDQLQNHGGNESDFQNNPSFQAAVKQFGEARATEAYKKAQEIAMSELTASQERPEASGQLVEVNDESEDPIIPSQLGAKKPEILPGDSVNNQTGLLGLQNRISELMNSILSGDEKVRQPFLLTEILNGGPKAQEALKQYLDSSKN
jgi:hypothetical protein